MTTTLKTALAALTSAFSLMACKEELPRPVEKEDFTIEYRFINEGDSNVEYAALYTYYNDRFFNEMKSFDSVKFSINRKRCNDCVEYLKVFVRFKEQQYSKLFAEKGYNNGGTTALGMVRGRTYLSDTIDISRGDDQVLTFKWPSDTLKYKEVIY